jgi:hypothetical protein
VIVPPIDKPQDMKRESDAYKLKRSGELSRFLNYCLSSETLKSDYMFERFIDTSDQQEYRKFYNKFLQQLKEVKHLN